MKSDFLGRPPVWLPHCSSKLLVVYYLTSKPEDVTQGQRGTGEGLDAVPVTGMK